MLQVLNKLPGLLLVWKQSGVSLKMPLGNPMPVCESQYNPVQEASLCLCVSAQASTSLGSAFNSRDHRQRMNRSGRDKRACEELKVHKAFLLCLGSRNSENIWTRQRHSGCQTQNRVLNFTQPKENSNGWDVQRKTFYTTYIRSSCIMVGYAASY